MPGLLHDYPAVIRALDEAGPAALGLGDWRFKWIMFPVGLFIKLVLAFLVILFLRERVLVSAEHLSTYGYERETSPFLSSLASRAPPRSGARRARRWA